MACGSRYRMTEVKERDGSIRHVPYVLAVKMRDIHGAKIIGEVPIMAEKEVFVQKKDGSFHQLPASIAEKLVKSGEAVIPKPKKASGKKESSTKENSKKVTKKKKKKKS